jgi:transposase
MGRKSVSKEVKDQIIGLHKGGFNYAAISRTLGVVSETCVAQTVKKYQLTGSTKDLPRTGRPKKTSHYDDNVIYRIARKNPTLSCSQIASEINTTLEQPISRFTVGRRLNQRKLFSYVATRKPALRPIDRIKRANFCRRLLRMSNDEIRSIIFSDESNYTIQNRKNRVLVRRLPSEKYNSRFCQPRVQNGGGSIGIWGSITWYGPGCHNLFEGRINRYNYVETLENHLIPTRDLYFGENGHYIFQQDGAPAHTARYTTAWLEENGIQVIKWPARSPDLNPIENVWSIIDRQIIQNPVTSLTGLEERLDTLFRELSIELCKKLFNSIKNRARLCLANKGGHIPY